MCVMLQCRLREFQVKYVCVVDMKFCDVTV